MSDKIIKKTLKIGFSIAGVVFILLTAAFLILRTPVVQTYLTQKLAGVLSDRFKTTITVKGVNFSFFNKLILEDVLIRDRQNDSLLFVPSLEARIDSFSIKKKYLSVNSLRLNRVAMNIKPDLSGKTNYQFLVDQLSKKDTVRPDSASLRLLLNQFEFNDARIRYAVQDSSGQKQVLIDKLSIGIADIRSEQQKLGFRITKFEFTNRDAFRLTDFTGSFLLTPDSISLSKVHVRTQNSEISDASLWLENQKDSPITDFKKLKLKVRLEKSIVSFKDLGQFIPSLKGMDENVGISGQIAGKLTDLKGKNIELSLGENTRLAFDFYLNGLPDISNTYIQLDLKKSLADLNYIRNIRLPESFPMKHLNIPASLLTGGILEYDGNFTGFLSDFVAFGTLRSKWGVLTTDLSFVPLKGDQLKINGHLKTVNFKAGMILQTQVIDRITFNGDVKGTLNSKNHDFNANVSGQIDSMSVNQYLYRNIELSGEIMNRYFNGSLIADDPNLKLRFDGEFDLNVPVPVFNFSMVVEKANLIALKLVDSYRESDIAFALNANFKGNNIDNLAGLIHFAKGSYSNENGSLLFDNFDLKTYNEVEPVLQLRSDFLDADIRGPYQLHNLYSSVKKIISSYLPSSGLKIPDQKTTNNFDFSLNLKDINRFTQVLSPGIKISPAKIEGRINSEKNTLVLNGTFPELQFQSTVFRKLRVNVDGNTRLNIRNKVDEIDFGGTVKVFNLSLVSEAGSDMLDSKLSWNNFDNVSYSGSILTSARFFKQEKSPHIEISVNPSRIFFADSLWLIKPALISIDSSLVRVNKLELTSQNQSITVDGSIAKNQTDKLNINFNRIDLNSLNTFMEDVNLKGELNGSLSLFDMYRKTLFLSNLNIARFGLLGQQFGNALVQSRWDPKTNEIDADLNVESDNRKTLYSFGTYNPVRDSLSIVASFDHFSLLILQPLMGSSFANFHGDATGKVLIHGSPAHIQHDGALYLSKAGLMISDLQVNYNLSDSVRFKGDKIIFPDMKVQDDYGNSGVFSGSIQHESFSKMIYDLTVKSNRIMAINTTPAINEQFYGKTFGSGAVRITGKGATVLIDGVARTEKGTDMSISLEYEEDAQEYDFLSFISHAYQPRLKINKAPVSESNIRMKFDIEVTPDAKAQLIYNSKIGDVIRSTGSGNLQMEIDNDYNVSLFGEYTVAQGDYLFTLQNVINKKFEIQRGGTIAWNGDPMDAVLNLKAIYRLKASLKKLFGESYTSTNEKNDFSQRVPVLCNINLTNSLNNPDISFDIELPTTEDRIRDLVKQYINSEEDRNKQILSLLVLGEFYTPEHLRGTANYLAANNSLVGSTASTASELFSNQFSNWLSQISNDFDIGFNYRPGNEITNNEIEFALSTQLFNDRVSINGNIGNNSTQRTSANNNSLVGDADVKVKLTNNGKLQLKAYNRANNNLIYETSPYTQGVGLTYREDFNDFKDLLRKMNQIFKPQKAKSRTKNEAKK